MDFEHGYAKYKYKYTELQKKYIKLYRQHIQKGGGQINEAEVALAFKKLMDAFKIFDDENNSASSQYYDYEYSKNDLVKLKSKFDDLFQANEKLKDLMTQLDKDKETLTHQIDELQKTKLKLNADLSTLNSKWAPDNWEKEMPIKDELRKVDSSISKIRQDIFKFDFDPSKLTYKRNLEDIERLKQDIQKHSIEVDIFESRYHVSSGFVSEASIDDIRKHVLERHGLIIKKMLKEFIYPTYVMTLDDIVSKGVSPQSYQEIIDDCKDIVPKDIYYGISMKKHPQHKICYSHVHKFKLGEILKICKSNRTSFPIENFVEITHLFMNYYNSENDNEELFVPHLDMFERNIRDRLLSVKKIVFDMDIIPLGRTNTEGTMHLLRDINYYKNFVSILKKLNDLKNILFIDYTGHISSFVHGLLDFGVDVVLQLPESASYQMHNVLDELQDICHRLNSKKITNKTCLGISLMHPHSQFKPTFDVRRLPTKDDILRYGFKRVVVTTELAYRTADPQDIRDETPRELDIVFARYKPNNFHTYLQSLDNVEVLYYGLNEFESKGASFKC